MHYLRPTVLRTALAGLELACSQARLSGVSRARKMAAETRS